MDGRDKDAYLAAEARARVEIDKKLAAADCYRPEARRAREETERFRGFTLDELLARDNASLDVFWVLAESLADAEHLPSPEIRAAERAEGLEAALTELAAMADSLSGERAAKP